MKDRQGRTIDYLRISVTDRCNFRCRYCMPADGTTLVPHENILTFEEILQIVRAGAVLGIHKIKLTGGEPLVRKNIVHLVEALHTISGITDITMTSNGYFLKEYAGILKHAGLSSVNVSLDTFDPERFAEITRVDAFDKVMDGIRTAKEAGLTVKINCAVMDDMKETEVLAFADFSIKTGIPVRFIEMMPIGEGRQFTAIDNDRLLGVLKGKYPDITQLGERLGNGPAVYYSLENGAGVIGFISSMHHKFCMNCNRVRLTSEGMLKLCLFKNAGINLRDILRAGATDEELQRMMKEAIAEKPADYEMSRNEQTKYDSRTMNQIGG